jgi:RNA polymerase sigma factor (sigma-70 family)
MHKKKSISIFRLAADIVFQQDTGFLGQLLLGPIQLGPPYERQHGFYWAKLPAQPRLQAMSGPPNEYLPTRSSLLRRLKCWDDRESWQAFFDTYWKLIYSVARKAGLSDTEAQDVVQETVVTVAKKMPDFSYDRSLGSFKGWLLNITRWRIADALRKRPPAGRFVHSANPDATARTSTVEAIPDPREDILADLWDAEWEHHLMQVALQRIKRQVNPRHYQIFDLYVIKNWPVEKVTRLLKVSDDQVYQVKSRLTQLLKEIIADLETKRL